MGNTLTPNEVQLQKDIKLFLELLELQTAFNDKTNGECWVGGKTKDGNEIDWFLCIRQEASELIDCFPWKHWKDLSAPINWENAKIEMVDILHFILSQLKTFAFNSNMTNEEIITMWLEEPLPSLQWESYTKGIDALKYYSLMEDTAKCADTFRQLCFKMDLTFAELRILYLAKNALNVFRQGNGYKDGTYDKMWMKDDKTEWEDNECLMKIISKQPGLTFDKLLSDLDIEYRTQKVRREHAGTEDTEEDS